jgi:DNA-binding NarL/FixJ family response regulator/GAF domain-containing protein
VPPEAGPALALVRSIAAAASPAELAEALAGGLAAEGPDGFVRLWETAGGPPEEVARHPLWRMLPDVPPATLLRAAGSTGPQRWHDRLFVSLEAGGAALGVLELHAAEPPDPALLALAAPAAAARFELLCGGDSRLLRAADVPSARDEIQAIVSQFAAQAKRSLDHDRLSIYLLSADGTALERLGVGTSPPLPGETERLALEDSGLSNVILANRGFVTDDVASDSRTSGVEDRFYGDAGFHAMATVPLRLGTRAFGVLSFTSRKVGFYRPGDLALAQQIADQIAVFLHNLRLQDAARRATERETTEQLVAIVATAGALAERARRADPELGRAAELLRTQTERILEVAQRFVFAAVPAALESSALDDALRAALERLRKDTGAATTLSIVGPVRELPAGVQAALFRIVEDCLDGIRSRPRGRTVDVSLELGGDLQLGVRTNRPEGGAERLPVGDMRRRAGAIGGRLTVGEDPDGCSVLALVVPGAGGLLVGAAAPSAGYPAGSAEAGYDRVIRVLVADERPAVRAGVRGLLEEAGDLGVVGEAAGAEDALTAVRLLQPDVVVLGDRVPDRPLPEAIAAIAACPPGPAVLVLSSSEGASSVAHALAAGATGYLAGTADAEAIVNAIRAVVGGATVVHAEGWAAAAEGEELTGREIDVLDLLASGASNDEIAASLGFAAKTVERVVADLARKLHARNRTQAVAVAVARGIVDVPSPGAAPPEPVAEIPRGKRRVSLVPPPDDCRSGPGDSRIPGATGRTGSDPDEREGAAP